MIKKRKYQGHRTRSQRFIVKVQRPLEAWHHDPTGRRIDDMTTAPAFMYNKDRTLTAYIAFDRELKTAMGDELKRYFWAYTQNGILHLDDIAEEQDW